MAPFKPIFEKKIKATSEMDSGRRIFLEEFFSTMKKNFPTEQDFATVLDSIMILIRRGIERWRFPLFTLLTHLLRYPFILYKIFIVFDFC